MTESKTDCIFCKIINREIPSYKVYEDDKVYAFLDISQVTPGHTLLVPKKHVANIFEYDQELARDVFSLLPSLTKALLESNPAIEGINILNNNGSLAYQSVFHSHIHLIPRYTVEDGFGLKWETHYDEYSQAELDQLAKSIAEKVEEK